MFHGLFIIILGTILTYYIWKTIFKNFIVLDSFIGIIGSILGTWFITFIVIEANPLFAIIICILIMICKLFKNAAKKNN